MKKLLLFLLVLVSLTFFTACGLYEIPLPIFEYSGKPIEEITYSTSYSMVGYTVTHKIDFVNNKVYRKAYYPSYDYYKNLSDMDFSQEQYESIVNSIEYQNTVKLESYKNNDVYIEIGSFTEEQEKRFIDACSSYGLFRLWKIYFPPAIVMDGTSWDLNIKYEDGKTKSSYGSNWEPFLVFAKCEPEFIALCGERVLGGVPLRYNIPPALSVSHSSTAGKSMHLADYSWNKGKYTSDNGDLYAINQVYSGLDGNFYEGGRYSVAFSSQGAYEDRGYKKFDRFIFKEYDYNESLTGERVLCDTGWFEHSETFELKANKIYAYELYYKNGDYVRYTFSTKVHTDKPRLTHTLISSHEQIGYENSEVGFKMIGSSYDWNGESREMNKSELLALNEDIDNSMMDCLSYRYYLTFSTDCYVSKYGDNKFEKLVLRSYRYDEELSDERVEFECGWFDGESERIELEFDRIYVYELHFANGDCVTYTFNTKYDSRY